MLNEPSRSEPPRQADEIVRWIRRLKERGLLTPANGAPSPDRFQCSLDDGRPDLVPRRLLRTRRHRSLFVNSSFRYIEGHALPEGFVDPSAVVARTGDVPKAWVRDPFSQAYFFYEVGTERYRKLLRTLSPGAPAPETLDGELKETLLQTAIIAPAADPGETAAASDAVLRASASEFREKRYTVLRKVLPPLFSVSLRRYLRSLVDAGFVAFATDAVATRYMLHKGIVTAYLQVQLRDLISRIVGEPINPSVNYLSCYREGSFLKRHTDRAQCEFSASMLVDFSPEPEDLSDWPLHLEGEDPAEAYQIDLGIGDMVVYKGRELVHYRNVLPEGRFSTSVFLHYVRPDFQGSLD